MIPITDHEKEHGKDDLKSYKCKYENDDVSNKVIPMSEAFEKGFASLIGTLKFLTLNMSKNLLQFQTVESISKSIEKLENLVEIQNFK